jgi:hypothetical protein
MKNEVIYLAFVIYNLDDEPNMEVQGAFKDINKAKQMLIGVMESDGERALVDKLVGDEKNITIYNEWPDRAYVIKTVEVEA